MEREIGEIFKADGKLYQVVSGERKSCPDCDLCENAVCMAKEKRDVFGTCYSYSRTDDQSVVFKEITNEAPGEKKEQVNHPSHYNNYDVEVIEMMRRIWGDEAVAIWAKLTAFKYRMRMGTKDDNPIEQDLAKEKWYLNTNHELTER